MASKEKIKVLVVASIFHTGGAETITREVFKRLDNARFEVGFCSLYEPGPTGKLLIADGFNVTSHVFKHKIDLAGFIRLRKILVQNSIDIVYVINQPMTSFWAVLAGFGNKIKTIVVSHNTFVLKSDWKLYIYFVVFKLANRIVTVSAIQKKQIIDEYGSHIAPISIIPNGIDFLKFRVKKTHFNESDGLCCIGMVARLEFVKGVDVFLDAAHIVINSGKMVKFLIVGGGSKSAELKKQSKRLGIDDFVSFLGERNDIPELVQQMDISVLSSRTEAMPMAILEYMVSKKAVIASDVGGVKEIIKDRVNGILVEPDKPQELANAMIDLIENPDLRNELALSGYESVRANYSIESTVANTQVLFENLVG